MGEITIETPLVKSTKVIILVGCDGRIFQVDAHEIIDNRSRHYVESDSGTTYKEEYEFLEYDESEITEWLFNNMDWQDCKTLKHIKTEVVDLEDLELMDYFIEAPDQSKGDEG